LADKLSRNLFNPALGQLAQPLPDPVHGLEKRQVVQIIPLSKVITVKTKSKKLKIQNLSQPKVVIDTGLVSAHLQTQTLPYVILIYRHFTASG